ncbi:unnamed protein product [Paramecium primaurelia]|uniref:Uncharacterized protein n=1 Tax=Paramecium primaurelia TaxID=5886 RepID=A0A8S1LUX5_PARPR|nr:unnamed protein product [Paramecium primaurelia]
MQQQPSLFFQCQSYVAEQSKPVSLIEFTKEDQQNQLPQEQLSNSRNQISDHKPKLSLQNDKINPYNSNWANFQLNKRYKIQVRCQGNQWVIKKVIDDEPSKSMVSSMPNLPKPIQSQGKLFSNTVSKQIKQRVNKFIVDQHRQYALTPNEVLSQQNSSLPHLNTNHNNHNSHNNKNKQNNNDIHNNNNNNNNENIIKIRLNSESPKQMPIFDINFIKNLQQFIV